MKSLPRAIFLMGPTASGKTGVAVELVERLPLEIISVDSALVYRDMDIGTAKPDAATLSRAPHHLIDIVDPTEVYSAAAFRHDALRLMDEIAKRGRTPLLVGGTMHYCFINLSFIQINRSGKSGDGIPTPDLHMFLVGYFFFVD